MCGSVIWGNILIYKPVMSRYTVMMKNISLCMYIFSHHAPVVIVVNEFPVLKADAIKYVMIFRSQVQTNFLRNI